MVASPGGPEADALERWSVRLARKVAPAEVELAPLMARAFAAGAPERDQLFARARGGPVGAFGPGEVSVVLPWVLQGLAAAGPALYALLRSGAVEKALAALKDLLAVRDGLRRKERLETLPADPYAPLRRTVQAVTTALESTELPSGERERITYRVLVELLEDPSDAGAFVRRLEEVGRRP